jgi:hypothetical protein
MQILILNCQLIDTGNDVIHQLTKDTTTSLYVGIREDTYGSLYELYDQFSVAEETDRYRLFLKGPVSGTLGKGEGHTGDLNIMVYM